MEYFNRFNLRNAKMPYSLDSWDIASYEKDGFVVRVHENFDGKDISWFVYQEYTDEYGHKHYITSPVFENVVEDGSDRIRLLYETKEKDAIFFIARRNGSDVVYRQGLFIPINGLSSAKLEDFGGDKAVIEIVKPNKLRVDYSKNGAKRVILFNLDTFKPYSNEFNGIYDDKYFIKSYPLDENNEYRRYIVGVVDRLTGEISPIAYDINRMEYIELPLTEDGLIDDEIMQNEKIDFCGYPRKNVEKDEIIWFLDHALYNFGVNEDKCNRIMEELDSRNKNRQR